MKTHANQIKRIGGIGLEVALGLFLVGILISVWKTPATQAASAKKGPAIKRTVMEPSIFAAFQAPAPGTICIQDDSTKSFFAFEPATGNYTFTDCPTGFTITGTGVVTRKGDSFSLQHITTARRVLANADLPTKKGKASVETVSPYKTYVVMDRDITNNTCMCLAAPPPPGS
jgi:hypothetical protein